MTTESDRVWIEDRSWRIPLRPIGRTCSFPRCDGEAVAILRRRRRSVDNRYGVANYRYCADHLYGRRIHGGRVEMSVSSDSPAAKRGYTNTQGLL